MLGDPWPEEPPDPFAEYERPSPKYREPSPPRHAARIMARRARERSSRRGGGGSLSEREVAVQSAFVGLLPVFHVGIFALSLGVLLLVFRGGGPVARLITVVGLVTCGYGCLRYLRYRRVLDAERRDR